jgi:alanine-alpha-ketoisovalerate/valine-pyruvate aminotransferase
MEILIADKPVSKEKLRELAKAWYGDLVKGVADVRRGVAALGGDWHIDANNILIGDGSRQEDIWGFNVFPDKRGDAAIEYHSLINIRPAQGNRDMELRDEALRSQIRDVVKKLLPDLAL